MREKRLIMFERINEFLSAQWLIHTDSVTKYLPLLISFLNGNRISAEFFSLDKGKYQAFAVSKPVASLNMVNKWELSDTSIPENSIAVIPVMGIVTKYGDNGTMMLMNRIREIENNPRISSVFYLVETPGGMVNNTDLAAEAIANTEKPSVAYVMGMCASAGMWLISGAKKIIASSKLDQFGSIGVKTNIMDINSFLRDKLGITVKDIYARLSIKKDFEYRELVDNNNDEPIKNALDFINTNFHDAIHKNLGIDKNSEVFQAGIYFAEKAIEMGLAHEIGSLEHALQTAYDMGIKSVINKYVKS